MTGEKGVELHPVTRVRHETLRGLLKGLKAVIEQGCTVKGVTVIPAASDALDKRARRIGGAAPKKREKDKKKGGRRQRPRLPGENDDDRKKRLTKERSKKYRARKKNEAAEKKAGRR